MSNIENITSNGFSLYEEGDSFTALAFYSLRIALRAYFSTYQTMKYNLNLFETNNRYNQETIDINHSSDYCEAFVESILHFHHFIELILKDLLRLEHPLLALDASRHHVLLHKLLNKESLDANEMEKLKSGEFFLILERICELIDKKRLGDIKLNFILEDRQWLTELNVLRNRIWHRGTFILRYPALDELVGHYIFPFISSITSEDIFSINEESWKYKNLNCCIDPIDLISKEMLNHTFNLEKVAFLKELARAAYQNPLSRYRISEYDNEELIKNAENIAKGSIGHDNVCGVKKCPVCGVHSLVVYEEVETEGWNPENESYDKVWYYTWQVKCFCCSFSIDNHLQNPSDYGLPIEDYWRSY